MSDVPEIDESKFDYEVPVILGTVPARLSYS